MILKDPKPIGYNNEKSINIFKKEYMSINDQDLKDYYSQIAQDYNLTETQFEMFYDFFNKKRVGSLIRTSMIKKLMYVCTKNRKQVVANEEDVDRALKALAKNRTSLDFEQLIVFLSFFFASKHNIKSRINCYLNYNDLDQNQVLSATEANEKFLFFYIFYGLKSSDKVRLYDKQVSFQDFADYIETLVDTDLFVRW
jgi:hypothetical protein